MNAEFFTPQQCGSKPYHSYYWHLVRSSDPVALDLFSRHYSCRPIARRRKLCGSGNHARIGGPGKKLVLITGDGKALFVWSAPHIRRDGQTGIYCSVFRNEGSVRSSDLIEDAVQVALHHFGRDRLYTFVNPRKIQSTNPGFCFIQAGWKRCGVTKKRRYHILEKCP